MLFKRKDDPFQVAADGCFAEDGVRVVDARLEFRDGPPPLGSEVLGRGRMALLAAIGREGMRGRSLRAKDIRVHLLGHDQVALDDTGPEDTA